MINNDGIHNNGDTKANDDNTPSLSNHKVFYPGNFPPQMNLQPFPMYLKSSFVL